MSLTRFGFRHVSCPNCPGSDVYVWANGPDQWECQHLGYVPLPGVMLKSPGDMINHLEEHRLLGQHVCQFVIDALREERTPEYDLIQRLIHNGDSDS